MALGHLSLLYLPSLTQSVHRGTESITAFVTWAAYDGQWAAQYHDGQGTVDTAGIGGEARPIWEVTKTNMKTKTKNTMTDTDNTEICNESFITLALTLMKDRGALFGACTP